MRQLRLFFLGSFFVLLFLEIWLGFPINLEKSNDVLPPEDESLVKSNVEKHMEGVHYVESRSGNRDWELFAQSAEGSEGAGDWQLRKVRVLFYSDDRVEYTVTGDNGQVDAKTRDMTILGHVITQSQNGYRFQSDEVHYLSQQRLIQSAEKVKMTGPNDANGKGIVITSKEMEAFVDTHVMRLKRSVLAQKALSDGKTVSVKSGVAEMSGKNRSVRFFEQVNIEMESMKLEGPEATFEYGEPSDVLKSLSVIGGVRVNDIDKFATSDTLNFDPGQNRFTLQGHPRVVQNNDELTGEKIILIDGGKKVRVEKMRARVEKLED